MKCKTFTRLLAVAAMALATRNSFGQCELTMPPNGVNLCEQYASSISNTSNSITIDNPSNLPTAGSYTATIHYYKQSTNGCYPEIVCPNATVTTSGNSVLISLGACNNSAVLTSDFATAFTVYINLVSNTGGYNYFFQNINGVCTLPLPIVITYFNGQSQTVNGVKQFKLNWQTATEQNSLRFDVMRSNDGSNWYKIGQVAAAGNSSQLINYSFTDATYMPGYNYYRLSLVDIDNTCDVSTVVWGKCDSENGATCAGTLPSPTNCNYTISGPGVLCNSGPVEFSISSVPDYSTIAWSVNSGAATVTPNSCDRTKATVSMNYATQTPLVLTATLSRCTYGITKSVNLWPYPTGTYYNNGQTYPLYTDNEGAAGGYQINLNCSGCSNLQWTRIEGSAGYFVYSNGLGVNFNLPQGQYLGLELTGTNDCGSFDNQYYFGAYDSYYSVSPNPAVSTITLSKSGTASAAATSASARTATGAAVIAKKEPVANIRQVQLYDALGVLRKTFNGIPGDKMQLNISDMQPGIYLLKIYFGDKVQTRKIRIK
jgi:hypothetical protein